MKISIERFLSDIHFIFSDLDLSESYHLWGDYKELLHAGKDKKYWGIDNQHIVIFVKGIIKCLKWDMTMGYSIHQTGGDINAPSVDTTKPAARLLYKYLLRDGFVINPGWQR